MIDGCHDDADDADYADYDLDVDGRVKKKERGVLSNAKWDLDKYTSIEKQIR